MKIIHDKLPKKNLRGCLGRTPAQGFTIVELMIVVMIIGLLATVAYPFYGRARTTTQINQCQGHQRVLLGALELYMFEAEAGEAVTLNDILPFVKGETMPKCPAQGTYSLNSENEGIQGGIACSIASHNAEFNAD
ncbi:MAG: prepilin-type N-terminal cleavage/methylation domain-containing protein [Verrucomicrobia bacterium]|nr:prepilin-type N-terminal cleavage/methylation domain-containing protein [Verrucomicrobiota bacterium]MCH8513368.1 prepilin-type N-terminal cleavage/methylation domain-containing protein [Kiritimatiellia bacterium]